MLENEPDNTTKADRDSKTDNSRGESPAPADHGSGRAADGATESGSVRTAPAPPQAIFQPPAVAAETARAGSAGPGDGGDRRSADQAGRRSADGPGRQTGRAEGKGDADDDADDDDAGRRRRRRGGRGRGKQRDGETPDESAEHKGEGSTSGSADTERSGDGKSAGSGTAGGGGRERGGQSRTGRNRGGRDRTAGDAADAATPDGNGEAGPGPDGDNESADEEASASTRRRRRRRRRGGNDDGEAADTGSGRSSSSGESGDPPNTVVHVREPRATAIRDEVQAVKGSTRLQAKKQRRREGAGTGRRRPPVITESEFLARREAVQRLMVIRQQGERIQIAVLEDGVLAEHYVDRTSHQSYVGNVYLGRVQNVLPSMEAAFVDIGKGRNAVLYAGEVNFDASGLEGQPKRIEMALKAGQSVLVQATKDPVGHKGARLTNQVSLPGRYLVYVPGASMTGISRKLPDTERTRLKQILKKVMPENAGVIVRTAAEGATEEELARDVARLAAQWEDIQRKSQSANPPALLYNEPDLTIRVVRDIFNEDFSELVVAGENSWDTVDQYVGYVAPHLAGRLKRWQDGADVFASYRIDEQLAKALERKVWLPSGGSLVIDRTEAMTVVDVNTGKFTGQGGNLEETVTRNNLEAAEEIVRQLRLRDVGGIIVIDFIDMVLESNRELVLRRLLECLARDRTKHQVAEVTSLGLVQMTRKRVGSGLLESFSEPCECCNGRGLIVSMEPVEPAHPGRRSSGRGAAARGGSKTSSKTAAADAEQPAADQRSGDEGSGSSGGRRRRRKTAARTETALRADETGPGDETPAGGSPADGAAADGAPDKGAPDHGAPEPDHGAPEDGAVDRGAAADGVAHGATEGTPAGAAESAVVGGAADAAATGAAANGAADGATAERADGSSVRSFWDSDAGGPDEAASGASGQSSGAAAQGPGPSAYGVADAATQSGADGVAEAGSAFPAVSVTDDAPGGTAETTAVEPPTQQPGPDQSGPAQSGPAESGSAEAGPAEPGHTEPGHTEPGPAESDAAEPGQAERAFDVW